MNLIVIPAINNLARFWIEKFRSIRTLKTQKHDRNHDKQVQLAKVLFQKVVQVQKACGELLKPIKLGPNKIDHLVNEAKERLIDFTTTFGENEYLLKDHTCELLRGIENICRQALKEHYKTEALKGVEHKLWHEQVKKQNKFFNEELSKRIPQLKEELKKDFRNDLGLN